MLITELFDTPVKYKLKKAPHGYLGEFSINDVDYSVQLSATMPESEITYKFFEQKFGKSHPMENPEVFDKAIEQFPVYEISFRVKGADNYELTKTGNEISVFSTVIHIIAEVIRDSKPIELQFSAKEASRQKLYDRMIKRIAKEFGFKDVSQKPRKGDGKDYLLVNIPN